MLSTATTAARSTLPDRFVMLNMDALAEDSDSPSRLQLPSPALRDPPPPQDDPSVATTTTFLAKSVGSFVHPEKNAFLRSLTLRVPAEPQRGDDSGGRTTSGCEVTFADAFADPLSVRKITSPTSSSSALSSTIPSSSSKWGSKLIRKAKFGMKLQPKHSVTIASIGGNAALSQIAVGDVVTKINGKKIGPSYNAQRCSDLVHKLGTTSNGIVSIQTGNDHGMDTILEATVLKPHPAATAEDLGLEVWWWRGLCVRSLERNSLFEHSGLKIDDELESINGISMTYNDKVTVQDVNRIIRELPCEVTVIVKRSKHRYTGEFD